MGGLPVSITKQYHRACCASLSVRLARGCRGWRPVCSSAVSSALAGDWGKHGISPVDGRARGGRGEGGGSRARECKRAV